MSVADDFMARDVPGLLSIARAVGHQERMAEVCVEPEVDGAWLTIQVAHEHLVGSILLRTGDGPAR
jgi:hypothetical protein